LQYHFNKLLSRPVSFERSATGPHGSDCGCNRWTTVRHSIVSSHGRPDSGGHAGSDWA